MVNQGTLNPVFKRIVPMKALVLSALLLTTTTSAFAAEKLLDCNISLGIDQQVTVLQNDNSLVLRELTNTGRRLERELSAAEWQGQVIQLRNGLFGDKNTLSFRDGEWIFESVGAGAHSVAVADCF